LIVGIANHRAFRPVFRSGRAFWRNGVRIITKDFSVATSYLDFSAPSAERRGLLPAAGILESPTKQPFSRNALMLAVHLIWGLIVGVFVETLLAEKSSPFGALLGSSLLGQKDRK
jgi:hypothetical protein